MKKNAAGFSLVELMVVVAIAVILGAFGYPSYVNQVAKGRRTDAQKILLTWAQAIENSRTSNGTYIYVSPPGTSVYYNFTPATFAQSQTGYQLSAVPKGLMSADSCGTFTLDQLGTRTSATSGCWAQ